jgi:hypothetical protein
MPFGLNVHFNPVCMGSPDDHCVKTEGLGTRRQLGREGRLGYFHNEYHVKNQTVN